MRLGTRWTAGTVPPAAVPAALHAQLAAVEALLPGESPRPSWTLTFLEGRPIAELDTGVTVSLTASGDVIVGHADDPLS
ncbi:hypothetical protein N3K63_07490 [Microbacterium sp. W1N]|uniref:hypothetical protein n=1 Tax=Microbacterium festucae TaxID=2977531 RepID=UPI0021BF5C1B|nr:hypothetical protein [Microbacterium festucae]MCT9820127.1 hypothetical protein [Microbacterium festucae]